MTTVSDQQLQQLVDAIVREADPVRIILFGSQAAGAADAGSDIDLLVVERAPFGPGRSRIDEYVRLRRALPSVNRGIDLLLYSEDEFERWRDATNHIVAHADREGDVLYKRP